MVYVDNGSGESGHILKRARRAREPDESILKNIYTTPAGTQIRSKRRTNGKLSTPLLSSVSYFDSRTANAHLDETSDVAYTPVL